MTVRSTPPLVLTALAAAAAGWLLAQASATRPVAVVAAARPAPAAAGGAAAAPASPRVVVGSDGNVTLHVDQQPLEWVIEQIVAQGGWVERPAKGVATAASGPAVTPADTAALPACASVAAPPRPGAEHVLQALARGTDDERADALLQARESGVVLPDELLKTSFEPGSADAVRLLAFEAYLERRQGDARATRAALEAALVLPGAALQAEARQRLAALDEAERRGAGLVQAAEGVP